MKVQKNLAFADIAMGKVFVVMVRGVSSGCWCRWGTKGMEFSLLEPSAT